MGHGRNFDRRKISFIKMTTLSSHHLNEGNEGEMKRKEHGEGKGQGKGQGWCYMDCIIKSLAVHTQV